MLFTSNGEAKPRRTSDGKAETNDFWGKAVHSHFFNWTLLRAPSGNKPTFWNDQLRVAYAQGQASVKLAAVELGKTLFESAEYAARQRDAHWYVYDLYKTYLMREPDTAGWAHWEGEVPNNGRENVRRAFELE